MAPLGRGAPGLSPQLRKGTGRGMRDELAKDVVCVLLGVLDCELAEQVGDVGSRRFDGLVERHGRSKLGVDRPGKR